jgi:hypothetical protein
MQQEHLQVGGVRINRRLVEGRKEWTAFVGGLLLLARLRAWFYAAAQPLASAVLWRRVGDLLSRIVADIETLEQLAVRILMPAAAAVLGGVVASAFLALFDPALGSSSRPPWP